MFSCVVELDRDASLVAPLVDEFSFLQLVGEAFEICEVFFEDRCERRDGVGAPGRELGLRPDVELECRRSGVTRDPDGFCKRNPEESSAPERWLLADCPSYFAQLDADGFNKPLAPNGIDDIKMGMRGSVEYGTGHNAAYDPNEPILGKTGTCTDYRVGNFMGWFGSFNEVGFHKLVVVVHAGQPVPVTMKLSMT